MQIHVHPTLVQLRFYEEGVDVDKPLYKMETSYRGVANVVIDDLGTARVSLLHCNDFVKEDYEEVIRICKHLQANKMIYRHNGQEHDVWL